MELSNDIISMEASGSQKANKIDQDLVNKKESSWCLNETIEIRLIIKSKEKNGSNGKDIDEKDNSSTNEKEPNSYENKTPQIKLTNDSISMEASGSKKA